MHRLYEHTFVTLDNAFHKLEAQVPKPQITPWKDGFVYRYKEQTIHQAIILKLARMISGLRAAYLLSENGFFQEQASLQRILDEIGEDIFFLVLAITNDTQTELHQRFLKEFFQEEFEEHLNAVESPQKRDRVSRKKIRGYISRIAPKPGEPTDLTQLSNTLASAYSGYVHAAGVHTMDMYGGYPPKFHLNGMLDTPRMSEYASDLWNYFYRSLMDIELASKAFGDSECLKEIEQIKRRYDVIAARQK
jgi:hypothetical protein